MCSSRHIFFFFSLQENDSSITLGLLQSGIVLNQCIDDVEGIVWG